MVFALRHITRWLLERKANCAWVQARLAAYDAVDPVLTDAEFDAIERHVLQCARCAEDLEALREDRDALAQILWPDEALPAIDVDAMVARIVSGEVDTTTACESQPAANPRFFPFHVPKPAAAFAAAAIFLVAVPVLAYVGGGLYDAMSPPRDGQEMAASQKTPEPQTLVMTSSTTSTAQTTSTNAERGGDSPACSSDYATIEDTFFAKIDEEAALLAARAEVEAMLPHTEEEYEAWARKEYPHILALYDILIGKGLSPEPPRQSNVPANWTKMTIKERFTALIPNDLPEDVRDALLEIAAQAAQNNELLWDGTPINIPDWAQRLYAATPEKERPTHWRALLIYSGEIFKLDWPESLNDPNCIPRAEVLRTAPSIVSLPLEPDADERCPTPNMTIPVGFVDALANDIPRANSVTRHIYLTAFLLGTPDFRQLSDAAHSVLCRLCVLSEVGCTRDPLGKLVDALLDSRAQRVTRALGSFTDGVGAASGQTPWSSDSGERPLTIARRRGAGRAGNVPEEDPGICRPATLGELM
jgi:hypothetical protein